MHNTLQQWYALEIYSCRMNNAYFKARYIGKLYSKRYIQPFILNASTLFSHSNYICVRQLMVYKPFMDISFEHFRKN